jgi:hypothetical protein
MEIYAARSQSKEGDNGEYKRSAVAIFINQQLSSILLVGAPSLEHSIPVIVRNSAVSGRSVFCQLSHETRMYQMHPYTSAFCTPYYGNGPCISDDGVTICFPFSIVIKDFSRYLLVRLAAHHE